MTNTNDEENAINVGHKLGLVVMIRALVDVLRIDRKELADLVLREVDAMEIDADTNAVPVIRKRARRIVNKTLFGEVH